MSSSNGWDAFKLAAHNNEETFEAILTLLDSLETLENYDELLKIVIVPVPVNKVADEVTVKKTNILFVWISILSNNIQYNFVLRIQFRILTINICERTLVMLFAKYHYNFVFNQKTHYF